MMHFCYREWHAVIVMVDCCLEQNGSQATATQQTEKYVQV